MVLNNPFIIAGYNGPEFFCDREQETATVLDALHNERNVTLVSPRRIGKTGLIHHCFNRLKEQNPEIVTLYLDIFSTRSLTDFINVFAGAVLGKLDSAPQKAFARVSAFIKSCRPVFAFDEVTAAPKVSLEFSPAVQENTLKEIFDYLKSSEKRCYIAIDEFQQVTEYPQSGVEALLRSYIQFLPNVRFIFSGSRMHMMQEMFASAKRPFYQSSQIVNIGPIDKGKYYDFAAAFFAQKGLDLPKEIFDSLYSEYDGYTWYLQYVLNRLYGYGKDVTTDMVELATEQILAEYNYVYSDIMRSCTLLQSNILKALATEGCVAEAYSSDFLNRYKLGAASSVRGALQKLLNNEIVYKTDAGYIVYDRFFSKWISEN